MFGNYVVDTVKKHYDDCYVTAHLEVPGEMFSIAMEKSLNDQGVVGSTTDILNFIFQKVKEAAATGSQDRLRFILGTEAGMVTSIVKAVQDFF
jgi:quinolinate synthase